MAVPAVLAVPATCTPKWTCPGKEVGGMAAGLLSFSYAATQPDPGHHRMQGWARKFTPATALSECYSGHSGQGFTARGGDDRLVEFLAVGTAGC